jgi:FeS assembly protein IscX
MRGGLAGPATVSLGWRDAEDIGIALSEKYPAVDPLTVRFTDLHKWVTELDDFSDDPRASSESTLEKIQMAWLDEHRNR